MTLAFTGPSANPLRPISEGGRRILDLLLKSGGLSQAEITKSLDLAQPTVARLLQGFQQDGLIKTANRQVDRPGNPSVHVTLNPDFAYSLGIALLGDVLSVLLMDFTGTVRGFKTVAMPDMSRPTVLAVLTRFKAELIAEANIDSYRIIGAGVGISGYFIGEGKLVNPPKYLNDWAFVPIEPIIGNALDLPVCLDNDGTVAAIGESLFGVGKRCANFAYLHLTNGFGGGLITNGKAFRGHHGNAGEFGGVWVLCDDGYPNLDLLKTCIAEHGSHFDTVEEMVQAIDVTWPGVETWLEKAVVPFSKLAGLLTLIVNPELVVIGGRLPPSIAQALADRITIFSPPPRLGRALPLAKMAVAEANGEAVSIGAAAMPLQNAFFG